MIRAATFSRDGNYRYVLKREWDTTLPIVMMIGLNPSTADALKDDATIKKCIRMSQGWGFGTLIMTNLFAWKATLPIDLIKAQNPIGPRNNFFIKKYMDEVDEVVCAWGNYGTHLNRAAAVCKLLNKARVIKLNKSGMPAHPLYQKDNSILKEFNL